MTKNRAQRGNYRDHRIELAARDMNHSPRPRPGGAGALPVLRYRYEPLDRWKSASWRFGLVRTRQKIWKISMRNFTKL
jgi:hypothetical protein